MVKGLFSKRKSTFHKNFAVPWSKIPKIVQAFPNMQRLGCILRHPDIQSLAVSETYSQEKSELILNWKSIHARLFFINSLELIARLLNNQIVPDPKQFTVHSHIQISLTHPYLKS